MAYLELRDWLAVRSTLDGVVWNLLYCEVLMGGVVEGEMWGGGGGGIGPHVCTNNTDHCFHTETTKCGEVGPGGGGDGEEGGGGGPRLL